MSNEMPRRTWLDQTLRVAEDAEIEVELQPNGDIECTIPIPECPSSSLTLIVPASAVAKVSERVQKLLAEAAASTAAVLALIS